MWQEVSGRSAVVMVFFLKILSENTGKSRKRVIAIRKKTDYLNNNCFINVVMTIKTISKSKA